MAGKAQFTADQFIKAIRGSGGIVTTIARKIGCDWHTVKKYLDTMPTVKQAYNNECEAVLDMAESKLLESIKEGDTQDAKWYLTKKGKHRGYGDAVDITSDGKQINPVVIIKGDEWSEL